MRSVQQHKGILGKASSGSTNAIRFGSVRAELVFAESVHMSQVLGKHKAGETVSSVDRELAELQKSSPRRPAREAVQKKQQPALTWSLSTLIKHHVV